MLALRTDKERGQAHNHGGHRHGEQARAQRDLHALPRRQGGAGDAGGHSRHEDQTHVLDLAHGKGQGRKADKDQLVNAAGNKEELAQKVEVGCVDGVLLIVGCGWGGCECKWRTT